MPVLAHISPVKPATGDLSAITILLQSWKSDTARLEALDKSSQALPIWRARVKELEEALVQAQNAPAWLSVRQAHAALGIPTSTIRYYCKHHTADIGAQKFRGMWRIDARMLEHFLSQPQVRTAATARAA